MTPGAAEAGQVTKGYLDLGVVGASLFIIVIFIVLFMKYNNKVILKSMNGNDKVDKLCDKIDTLVQVIHTQQTESYKDNKSIIALMNRQLDTSLDIQRRVVRIDDRTFACRGNPEVQKSDPNVELRKEGDPE